MLVESEKKNLVENIKAEVLNFHVDGQTEAWVWDFGLNTKLSP